MLPNFLVKAAISPLNCLSLNNSLVIEQFRDLRSYLIDGVSREVAALFAEPVVTEKTDALDIAWYAEPAGEPLPLHALDPDARRIVVDKLAARLQTLAPLLSGASGALLARALYVADEAAIMAVGQEPVLIRWGMVADGVDPMDQSALNNHFAATLGRYVPFAAPIIVRRPSFQAPPVAREMPPAMPMPVSGPIDRRIGARRHLWLGAATAVAALIALVLAVPGVLAKHEVKDPGIVSVNDAQKITASMQERVDKARAALAAAKCDPTGKIDLPGKQADLPPATTDRKGSMALVARRATESVVLVLTCVDRGDWDAKQKDDGKPHNPLDCPDLGETPGKAGASRQLVALGSGSGFFIAPRIVVTNRHVVEGAAEVFVVGRGLPRAMRATVKAITPPKSNADSPDFAALEVDLDQSPPPIGLSTNPSLLQDVVAAGFPGVIIDHDPQLDQLLHGDSSAIPALTTFPGSITLLKDPDDAMPLIFSSAVIGHGNSGGPLLNLCGDAVGMNTLGWSGKEEDTGYKVNVAEGAKALSAFLDSNKIDHARSAQRCEPGVQAAIDTPPPDAPKPPPPAPQSGK